MIECNYPKNTLFLERKYIYIYNDSRISLQRVVSEECKTEMPKDLLFIPFYFSMRKKQGTHCRTYLERIIKNIKNFYHKNNKI